jgi:hypothetical protein
MLPRSRRGKLFEVPGRSVEGLVSSRVRLQFKGVKAINVEIEFHRIFYRELATSTSAIRLLLNATKPHVSHM